MKSAVSNDLPHLTSEEIATRCQAIRRKWTGRETERRRRDGQRQMRELDRQLRCSMGAGAARFATTGPLDFMSLIAG